MSKVLSVRLDDGLYTKCLHHDLPRKELVSKALVQYFRSKEPNSRLDPGLYTTVYNKEYVELLQQEIVDLRKDKEFLQGQCNAIMLSKTPLLQRIILRLKGS